MFYLLATPEKPALKNRAPAIEVNDIKLVCIVEGVDENSEVR